MILADTPVATFPIYFHQQTQWLTVAWVGWMTGEWRWTIFRSQLRLLTTEKFPCFSLNIHMSVAIWAPQLILEDGDLNFKTCPGLNSCITYQGIIICLCLPVNMHPSSQTCFGWPSHPTIKRFQSIATTKSYKSQIISMWLSESEDTSIYIHTYISN